MVFDGVDKVCRPGDNLMLESRADGMDLRAQCGMAIRAYGKCKCKHELTLRGSLIVRPGRRIRVPIVCLSECREAIAGKASAIEWKTDVSLKNEREKNS